MVELVKGTRGVLSKYVDQEVLKQAFKSYARQTEKNSINPAHGIAIIYQWMQQDILVLAGLELKTREKLFDFIVEELRKRKP